MNAAAIHQIDQILNLINADYKTVFSIKKRLVTRGDAHDHLKLLMILKNKIIVDIETSWAQENKQYSWFISGTNGIIYDYNSNIFIKYFKNKNIQSYDRGGYSYLSNEKINWSSKKYSYVKEGKDNYGSIKFYKNLYQDFSVKKINQEYIKSVLKTLNFIKTNI